MEFDDELYTIAIQKDGKILAGGYASSLAVIIRYNINGIIDSTFGINGFLLKPVSFFEIRSIQMLPDGKFIAVGQSNGDENPDGHVSFCAARYLNNGITDSSYGIHGITFIDFFNMNNTPLAASLLKNNDIILAGLAQSTHFNIGVAKLKSNGIIDSSFGINGKTTTDFGLTSGTGQIQF